MKPLSIQNALRLDMDEQAFAATWHNFFAKHAWNKTLQKAFRSFLKDHEEDIAEIKSNFH